MHHDHRNPADERRDDVARGPGDLRAVRRWISGLLIAIIVAIVIAAVTSIATANRRNATSAADDTVRRIGERTADLVMGHLDDAASSIAQLQALADADVLSGRSTDIDRYLAAQVVANTQLSGAFVGYPDGSFRFVQREEDALILRRIDGASGAALDSTLDGRLHVRSTETVETDYDPRQRPWYAAAESAPNSTWTEPYVFFRSGRPGVTLARAVRDRTGITQAVFGVDVSLAELRRFLDDLPIDDGAEAFLTAGATIVAAPASHAVTTEGDGLATIEEIGLSNADLRQLMERDEPLDIGDQRRFHRIELSGPDAPEWAVLIRTERTGLVDALDRGSQLAILVVTLAGLLLILATPFLTRWLRRPMEELSRQARTDSLTHVANRRTFLSEARLALEQAKRFEHEFTVAVIDVDDFKQFNDRFGHAVGDRVLYRVGATLRRTARPTDLVGRLGGDELAIAVEGLDRGQVDAMLQRVQEQLADDVGADPTVGVTIGVAALGRRDLDLEDLVGEADEVLLAAKQIDKGSISWHARAEAPDDATPLHLS